MQKDKKNGNKEKYKNFKDSYDFSKFQLNDNEKQILTLKLDNYTQRDIAKKLKKNEDAVSVICNKPEFKRAFNSFQESIVQQIIDARFEVLNIYLSILRDNKTSANVRAGICEKLLKLDELNFAENGDDSNELNFKGWE